MSDRHRGSLLAFRSIAVAAFLAGIAHLVTERSAHAQGRWDISLGAFRNPLDSQSTSGLTARFTRWPRSERVFQRGFRLELLRGRQDEETLPAYPEVPLSPYSLIVHTWSSLGLSAGIPFQVAPTTWPVRPFLDADPGLLIYRSLEETRYTRRNGETHVLYVEDESAWRIGPTIGVGTGFEVPGRGRTARLQVRGGYRFGWFFGNEGVGTTSNGVLQVWTVTAGVSAPF